MESLHVWCGVSGRALLLFVALHANVTSSIGSPLERSDALVCLVRRVPFNLSRTMIQQAGTANLSTYSFLTGWSSCGRFNGVHTGSPTNNRMACEVFKSSQGDERGAMPRRSEGDAYMAHRHPSCARDRAGNRILHQWRREYIWRQSSCLQETRQVNDERVQRHVSPIKSDDIYGLTRTPCPRCGYTTPVRTWTHECCTLPFETGRYSNLSTVRVILRHTSCRMLKQCDLRGTIVSVLSQGRMSRQFTPKK